MDGAKGLSEKESQEEWRKGEGGRDTWTNSLLLFSLLVPTCLPASWIRPSTLDLPVSWRDSCCSRRPAVLAAPHRMEDQTSGFSYIVFCDFLHASGMHVLG